MGFFDSLLGKHARKFLKRKDSDAGEAGRALEELKSSLYNELRSSEGAKRQQQRFCGPVVALTFNFMVAVGIIMANNLMSIGVGWRRQSHGGGFLEATKTIPRESSNSKVAPKKEKAPPSSKPAKFGGGKQKKKKWSKGKQKEKVNNVVLSDQGTYDKLLVEAPTYKLITPSILSDRLRVGISSDVEAAAAIKMGKGLSDRKVIVLL